MINKIRLLFLLITLGVCAFSGVTLAGECSEEAKQAAREALKGTAKSTCATMKSNAQTYNNLAKDYISSCSPNLKPGAIIAPSQQVISAAEQIGESISDASLYEYRNIPWAFEIPPLDKPECAGKLEQVKAAKRTYENIISSAQQQLYATNNAAQTNCQCDENGVATCPVIKPDTNKDGEDIEAEGGECQITGFLNALSACPLCPVFEVVMKTNADIAHMAWEATAKHLSKTVGIFFLVLLALEALKAVASVGGSKPSAVMKGVLILGLKIAITLGLLSNSGHIYGTFISPVVQGGLEMGLAVAGNSSCPAGSVGSVSSEEISPDLQNSVICTVRNFSKEAATMPAIGMGLICISESFSMFLSGLIILFFGIMIWLAFSFYLIDATVQLGMLCALVPLLIACWPFQMTKQYTTKGVRMLMNTFFTFAFAGVLILLAISYVTAAITGGGTSSSTDLINAINNNDKRGMEYLAALEGASIFTLIACCVFAMKMISKVSGLASQFASGSGMAYGAKLGGMAASAATSGAKFAAGKTAKLGGVGLAALGEHTKAGRAVTSGAKSAMAGIQRGYGQALAGIGRAAGLGKFQNRKAGDASQTKGTEQEKGREAAPNNKLNNTAGGNNGGGNNGGGAGGNNGGGGNGGAGGNNSGGNNGGDNGTTTNNNNSGGGNGGDNGTTTNNNNSGGGAGGNGGGGAGGNNSGGNNGGDNGTTTNNNNSGGGNNGGGADGNNSSGGNGGNNGTTTNNNNSGGNGGAGGNNGGDAGGNNSGGGNGGDNGTTTNNNNSSGGNNGGAGGNNGGGGNGGNNSGGGNGGDNGTTTNNNNSGGNGNNNGGNAGGAGGDNGGNNGGDNGGNNNNTETIQNDDGSTTQKSYDENGKLQRESTTDKDGNKSWKSYNEDGSIKAQGNLNADGTGNATINDEHGNKMQENSWDKNGNESSKFYDKEGKLAGTQTTSKDDQGNTHWRNTDANGKMTSAGVNNKDGSAVQMDYNENGKVQREIHRSAGGGMEVKNHSYDENGNYKPRKFLGKVIK